MNWLADIRKLRPLAIYFYFFSHVNKISKPKAQGACLYEF